MIAVSNSESASRSIPIVRPSELTQSFENGSYIGRTAIYKVPFFLDTKVLLNPHLTVIGMTGSGKTYFLKSYISRKGLSGSSILIIDWNGEYDEIAAFLGGKVLNVAPDTQSFDIEGLLGSVNSINISRIKDEAKRQSIANSIIDKIIETMHLMQIDDRRERIIVLDEAWKLLGSKNNLGQLFREGRKYGFSVVVSTQLASDIKNEIIANAGTIAIFRLQNNSDYSSLIASGIALAEHREALADLKQGSCMLRLSFRDSNAESRFFIKKVDGSDISIYTIRCGKMQLKVTRAKLAESNKLVESPEIRSKILNFIDANRGDIDLLGFIKFLIALGLERKDILPYLRELGLEDMVIVKAFTDAKSIAIVDETNEK